MNHGQRALLLMIFVFADDITGSSMVEAENKPTVYWPCNDAQRGMAKWILINAKPLVLLCDTDSDSVIEMDGVSPP